MPPEEIKDNIGPGNKIGVIDTFTGICLYLRNREDYDDEIKNDLALMNYGMTRQGLLKRMQKLGSELTQMKYDLLLVSPRIKTGIFIDKANLN